MRFLNVRIAENAPEAWHLYKLGKPEFFHWRVGYTLAANGGVAFRADRITDMSSNAEIEGTLRYVYDYKLMELSIQGQDGSCCSNGRHAPVRLLSKGDSRLFEKIWRDGMRYWQQWCLSEHRRYCNVPLSRLHAF